MPPSRPASPIAALWAWDNAVDPAVDPRGRGYAPAAPERLAAFARAGGLREVHLLAPRADDGEVGPVDAWLRETVDRLHDDGVVVTAVASVPRATASWARATTALAAADRLQVLVVPWTEPAAGSVVAGRAVLDAVGAVRASGTDLPVDVAVPWWFATATTDDGRTLLEPVLGAVDRVALGAPGAYARGPGGVLERARPAVDLLVAAARPFLVGVQADTPDVAGGPHLTFFDEGPVALVRESGTVAAELAGVPGFEGVAVRSHRSWRRLLGV